MRNRSSLSLRRSFLLPFLVTTALITPALFGAEPSSGTLSPDGQPATWIGTSPGGSSPEGESTCLPGVTCETFTLTIAGTQTDWSGKQVRINIEWLLPSTDYDVYVHKDTVTGPEVDHSADGTTVKESCVIDVGRYGTGVYVVNVVYWAATSADQYHGTAMPETLPAPAPPPAVSTASPPAYTNHQSPAGLGNRAGEPTIGVNWKSGNAMFIASLQTLRVAFDEALGTATWVNKSAPNTSVTSFDPILFTDSRTNRTFVSQLLPDKNSLMSFTDDDGESWTPSMGSGINSGVDHQTVGGGPFKAGITGRGPLTAYPDAVYYASQDIGLAEIALSRDGGLTFDVAVPMYDLTQCGGLHGHIKVAPDGTVYVPNKSCGDQQAVMVSEDNGLNWQVRRIPGSTSGDTDPSVGIASDGTVYAGFVNGDGTAWAAVSRDRGVTWTDVQNIGYYQNVQNAVFPAAAAGDPDRASVFFLGTDKGGAGGVGTDRTFDGVWYGYIATTYDGGKTWVTVNATPNDPVQRGVVCTFGTTCPSGTRNLLDFNDMEIDRKGRVHAAFADGCITADCIAGVDRTGPNGVPDGKVDSYDNDGARKATIIRQSGGRTLFAAYDSPNAPTNLSVSVWRSADARAAYLTWTDNANNESAYSIERSTSSDSGFAVIATAGTNASSYLDQTVQKKTRYYYRVRALNANGASAYSNTAAVYIK